MRRIIVGWDAADPDAIVKGAGYETEYPTASYVVRANDVRRAIRKVMRVRRLRQSAGTAKSSQRALQASSRSP